MLIEIFLSHNARDLEWTQRLALAARALGIEPYLAEHDVQAGTPLADKIQTAIRRSSAVIVLISDNSVNAPYVREEIGFALGCKKLVIPIVQTGIPLSDLAMLQGVEYIPLDFDSPETGLKSLNTTLIRLINRQQKRDQDNAILIVAVAALIVFALNGTNF